LRALGIVVVVLSDIVSRSPLTSRSDVSGDRREAPLGGTTTTIPALKRRA